MRTAVLVGIASLVLLGGCVQTTKPTPGTSSARQKTIAVIPVAEAGYEHYSNKGGQAILGLLGALVEHAATTEQREQATNELRAALTQQNDPRVALAQSVGTQIKPCFRDIRIGNSIREGSLKFGDWKGRSNTVVNDLVALKGAVNQIVEIGVQNIAVSDGLFGKAMTGAAHVKVFDVESGSLIRSFNEWNGVRQQVTFEAQSPAQSPESYRLSAEKMIAYLSVNIAEKLCGTD